MRSVLKMTFWYTKTGVFGFEERKTRPNRLPQAPRPISAFVYFSGPYFLSFGVFSALFVPIQARWTVLLGDFLPAGLIERFRVRRTAPTAAGLIGRFRVGRTGVGRTAPPNRVLLIKK